MRHVYIRLIVGIVWIVAAIVSLVMANYLFAGIGALAGAAFLYSAFSSWRNEKKDNGEAAAPRDLK